MLTNDEEPIWESKPNLVTIIPLVGFASMVICICLAKSWDADFLSEPYLPFDNGLVLIIILILFTITLYLALRRFLTKYVLYEDRLTRRFYHKPEETYYLADLTNWTYIESTTRGGTKTTEKLKLFFTARALTFRSSLFADINGLTKWMNDEHPNPDARSETGALAVFLSALPVVILMIGSIFVLGSTQQYIDSGKGTGTTTLHNLTLSDPPDFIPHTHKNSSTTYGLSLKTDQIKDFDLSIHNIGDQSDKADIENKLHQSDTLDVSILSYDYAVKISHTKEPSFWDKHFGWRRIKIKHIRSAGISF